MKALLMVTALACLATAARSDDWPLVRHDASSSAATQEAIRPPFTKVWSKKGATKEALLVAGNTLLYTSRRFGGLRDLQAVNASTGKPLWTLMNVAQPGAASAGLGVVVTIVRTSAKPTSVSRLGANLWPTAVAGVDLKTGKVRWTYPLGEHPTYPAITPVTLRGSRAYVAAIPYCVPGDECGKGSLICLNAKTGEEVARYDWAEAFGGQVGVPTGAPALNAAGTRVAIAVGYRASETVFGGQVWLFAADERLKDGPIARIGDPDGDPEIAHKGGTGWPVFSGSMLAVQGPGDVTHVWNTATAPAQEVWEGRYTRDVAHALAAGGSSSVLLESNSGTGDLFGVNLKNGKRIWSKPIGVTGLACVAGRIAFVPARDRRLRKAGASRGDVLSGVLYALDVDTGKTLWSVSRPDATYNTPVPANGRLFVTDTDGNLTCYEAKH